MPGTGAASAAAGITADVQGPRARAPVAVRDGAGRTGRGDSELPRRCSSEPSTRRRQGGGLSSVLSPVTADDVKLYISQDLADFKDNYEENLTSSNAPQWD